MQTLIEKIARAFDEKVGTDLLALTSLERKIYFFGSLSINVATATNIFFSNNVRLNFFPFLESKFK